MGQAGQALFEIPRTRSFYQTLIREEEFVSSANVRLPSDQIVYPPPWRESPAKEFDQLHALKKSRLSESRSRFRPLSRALADRA